MYYFLLVSFLSQTPHMSQHDHNDPCVPLLRNALSLSVTSQLEMTESTVMSLHCRFKALRGFEWLKRGRADSDGQHHCRFVTRTYSVAFFIFHCRSDTWASNDIGISLTARVANCQWYPLTAQKACRLPLLPPHSHHENIGACTCHSLHCYGCSSPWLSLLDFEEWLDLFALRLVRASTSSILVLNYLSFEGYIAWFSF